MKKRHYLRRSLSFIISMLMILTLTPATSFAASVDYSSLLSSSWTEDQDFRLADPAPWNIDELKQVVDVSDPRSVAAYWAWSITRMVDDYDDGIEMLRYLYADLEPFGRGFTEGGAGGKAGWSTYLNSRLESSETKWLPRAYFNGANSKNAYKPSRPLTLDLYYNEPNTKTLNKQSYSQLGRLNIVYWIKSNAAGNKVNINLSKFEDSDRWYVTSNSSSGNMFYKQSAAGTAAGKASNDDSTAQEHYEKYGGNPPDPVNPDPFNPRPFDPDPANPDPVDPDPVNPDPVDPDPFDPDPVDPDNSDTPFTDVSSDAYFADAVNWAYSNNITKGTTNSTFSPNSSCTRGQVLTFLWRAEGKPEPKNKRNPFSDIKSSDYYYKPILWAVEKGITSGTSANKFSPNQKCSSAHIITFLYRSKNAGSDGWYKTAAYWADQQGMLDGTGIAITPNTMCPRGAVVTFLYRAMNPAVG